MSQDFCSNCGIGKIVIHHKDFELDVRHQGELHRVSVVKAPVRVCDKCKDETVDSAYEDAIDEALQKKVAEDHRKKYPLASRWSANHNDAQIIIDFLNWLTNGERSEFTEEGHHFEIAAWGEYKDDPMPENGNPWDRFEWALKRIASGGERLIPVNLSAEDLVYAYFGINTRELDKERRAMLDELRAQTAKKAGTPKTE